MRVFIAVMFAIFSGNEASMYLSHHDPGQLGDVVFLGLLSVISMLWLVASKIGDVADAIRSGKS
jgi:spore maturation protein SpmA